ncbi:MAG: sulfurtransferase TusA family protein [Rhizobiales bacterium]|jgi:tRNA 2-thiouridine synthesizing protein A|nr:sulfurtransferase TusA family protein [Hyphomicrobiales bacterium]MBN9077614.1 sulfurtransferase TusA family protein [Hyphomicrobiales bacterium]
MEQDVRQLSADAETYDLRGLTCPLPVLRASKRLAGMPSGALLWVETTDPLAVIDIPAFCKDNGHNLRESYGVEGGHRFLIERG